MKLIIDIDDEMVCNDIKSKALEPTSVTDEIIINALYNGTPVSTEGDLISRSALKKTVENEEGISWVFYGKDDLCVRKKYIDNAPAVAPDRPQGEWICPKCDLYSDEDGDKEFNYCQYAGQFTMGCDMCHYFVQKGGVE